MTAFSLHRLTQNDQATLGYIEDEANARVCVTLELPWRNNGADVSSIPPGSYEAFRFMSPKRGYELFKLRNVPGRSDIELHIGNKTADTDGCILLGTTYGPSGDGPMILRSKDAFQKFMVGLDGIDSFTLTVLNPEPEIVA